MRGKKDVTTFPDKPVSWIASLFRGLYIYIYIYWDREKTKRQHFNPYKPVWWLLTHQEILKFFSLSQYIWRSTSTYRALYYGKIETQTSYICMYIYKFLIGFTGVHENHKEAIFDKVHVNLTMKN